MSSYKEVVDVYVLDKMMEPERTDIKSINSGEPLKSLIDQEVITDITVADVTLEMNEVLKDITKEEKQFLVIYEGELCYVYNKNVPNNKQKAQWCESVGIKILQGNSIEPEGIEIRNGDYELINGIYVCTPKLVGGGFVKEKTRYLEVDSNGNLVPGNWITHNPTDNWYSYKEQKWANIYVENDGSDVYFVWIPRYCFKLYGNDFDGNPIPNERSDVKFVDLNNNYKDEEGNETEWAALQAAGYQVPEAFTFAGQDLPGYWAMKYTAGDITTPTILNFDMSVTTGKVNIKNITTNTTKAIKKFTIALNGEIVKTITDAGKISNINKEEIYFEGLRKGNNTINLTALDEKGEIIGSMTKEYATADINEPVLTAFNQETTFYVTYDESGKEHSTIPISEAEPKNWYEYGSREWANIVTRNNDLETYFVWIPRYEFKLDYKNERSTVKFIKGTGGATEAGYQVPEAFTFNGQQIKGYWAMKYTAGDAQAAKFNTEVVANANSIQTKGITGSSVAAGQVYKYYLNGEYKGEKTNAFDVFEYNNLQEDINYTILVEIRNSTTDDYLGTIVKQIRTINPNKPDLIGFNEEYTYYVLYDNDGNETIGEKIKNDGSNAPDGWYNYSLSKWANIVVQYNGMKTYYTWIPRYQFRLDQENQRSIVKFIKERGTDTEPGFQIPEAFTFAGQQLRGYWAMKYTAGE